MDPEANIKEQIELAKSIRNAFDSCPNDTADFTYEQMKSLAADGDRLAELVLSLDEWRRRKG